MNTVMAGGVPTMVTSASSLAVAVLPFTSVPMAVTTSGSVSPGWPVTWRVKVQVNSPPRAASRGAVGGTLPGAAVAQVPCPLRLIGAPPSTLSTSDVRVTSFGPVLMTRTVNTTGPPGSLTTVGLAVFTTAMTGRICCTTNCSFGSPHTPVLTL